MRKKVHQQIFQSLCLLLAFFLPVFPGILPAIILLMSANWLISGDYLAAGTMFRNEKWRYRILSLALLYLLYLAGMLYSKDFDYGWFDLEVKLSLLVFPLIFSLSRHDQFNKERLRKILIAFVAGCITGSIILLVHTWIVNARNGVADAFYYTNLTWYFHASYLALYTTFAIAIILLLLVDSDINRGKVFNFFLITILIYLQGFIFLLSSKAGLLSLATIEVLFIILLIYKKFKYTVVSISIFTMVLVFAGFAVLFPYAFGRISKADAMISKVNSGQTNPEDGTVARMEIWKVSAEIIREHPLSGVGTGDVKDVLMQAYQDHQLYPILHKKLNSHNQYLQTFIAIGVFGFLALVLLLVLPAVRAIRKGDYIYFIFLLTFGMNMLFESMLETQAGVIYFAFFNVLLFTNGVIPIKSADKILN